MYRKIKNHYFTLDWLSFTFSWKTLREVGIEVDAAIKKHISIWQYFKHVFPEFAILSNDMITLEHGRFGYDQALSFNNELMIMTDSESNKDDFGVFVTIPSHGLYILAKIFDLPDFNQDFADTQKLFQVLLSRGAKITRLDICYDDYKKHLTPGDWSRLFEAGYIECKTRHKQSVNSPSGSTFYLGKRGKSRMLRVYDKAGESHGQIDAIRYEFEFKNDFAYRFADSVAQGQKFTFLDILDDFCVIHNEPVANISMEGNKAVYDLIQSWYKRQVGGVLESFERLREDIRNYSQNAECNENTPVLVPKVTHHYDFFKKEKYILEYVLKGLEKHCLSRGPDGHLWLLEQMHLTHEKFTESDWELVRHNSMLFKL